MTFFEIAVIILLAHIVFAITLKDKKHQAAITFTTSIWLILAILKDLFEEVA